jgi:predicted nucleic acid-binding protein
MSQTVVVLDSSALIAHINGKDLWHKKAEAIATFIAYTERHVILPSEVFAETLNRLGNNIGRQAAVRAGRALLARHAAGDLLLTHSNPTRAAASRALLQTVEAPHDKRPSYVDFPIGGFSPPEGRLARGFKLPAFSRFLFQSAVKSAESF